MAAAMLMRMPRMVVDTAWRVLGEPWAQMRRSVPVWNLVIGQFTGSGASGKTICIYMEYSTHWHDFSSFPNHSFRWTHIHRSAVQTAASLLNTAHDKKHSRLPRNSLQLLPRPIAPDTLLFVVFLLSIPHNRQFPPHPRLPTALPTRPNHIAQVHGTLEIPEILVSPFGRPAPDHAPKRRAARVAAQVGLGEQQDVGAVGGCCATGEMAELRECCGGAAGGVGCGGGGCEADEAWGRGLLGHYYVVLTIPWGDLRMKFFRLNCRLT